MSEGKEPIFRYGETEIQYLKQRDPKLGAIIDQIGPIERTVDDDLFSAIVHHIVGQQISTKAQQTIWRRMREDLGKISAETILEAGSERLQGFGMTYKKVEYIEDCARKAASGELNLKQLPQCSDKEIIDQLVSLKGVGVWTAEMILLFCLQRPDVFSYGDLAILRGLRMVYHHRKIDRKLFEKSRRRFSPYGSVASLYLWAVASGAVEGMKDYAPKSVNPQRTKSKAPRTQACE
mgnify:FL=1